MRFMIIAFLLSILAGLGYSKVLDCVCGQESLDGLIILQTQGQRIVNGTEVIPHKYPWMAVMMKNYHHVCGGTIISDRLILTAGHCMVYIPNPKESNWIVGAHSIKAIKYVKQQSYKTKDYHLHPLWVAGNLFDKFDFAMIVTDRRITFSSSAIPICLPKADDEKLFLNQPVTVAGWGRIEENGAQTDVLLETNVYLKTQSVCRKMASAIKYDERAMICAYEQYTDACQGDSGGPLFAQKSKNHYIILGVTSFGEGCARSFPGIYSKVTEPYTINWIHQMLSKTGSNVCENPEDSFLRRILMF